MCVRMQSKRSKEAHTHTERERQREKAITHILGKESGHHIWDESGGT